MTEALIGALGGVCVLLVRWILDRRVSRATAKKVEAEAGLTIDARWEKLTDEYGQRLAAAEGKVEVLETDVAELKRSLTVSEDEARSLRRLLRSMVRWAIAMREEIIKLGGIPPSTPVDVEFAITTLEPE